VIAVAWSRLGTVLLAGYSNGIVCRWDIKRQIPVRSETAMLSCLSIKKPCACNTHNA
jgi:hypothetical protein